MKAAPMRARSMRARAAGRGDATGLSALRAAGEEGLIDGEIVDLVIHRYLDGLLAKKPHSLVLGCTHYPALKSSIAKIAGPDVVLVDSAATTALAVEARLRADGCCAKARPAPHGSWRPMPPNASRASARYS